MIITSAIVPPTTTPIMGCADRKIETMASAMIRPNGETIDNSAMRAG